MNRRDFLRKGLGLVAASTALPAVAQAETQPMFPIIPNQNTTWRKPDPPNAFWQRELFANDGVVRREIRLETEIVRSVIGHYVDDGRRGVWWMAKLKDGTDLIYGHWECPVEQTPIPSYQSVATVREANLAAALYYQGRVHHHSPLPDLEEMMSTWNPWLEPMPPQLQAVVAAISELNRHSSRPPYFEDVKSYL